MRRIGQVIYVKWTSMGPIRLGENGYVLFGNHFSLCCLIWLNRGTNVLFGFTCLCMCECGSVVTHIPTHTHISAKAKEERPGFGRRLLFPSLGFLTQSHPHHPNPVLDVIWGRPIMVHEQSGQTCSHASSRIWPFESASHGWTLSLPVWYDYWSRTLTYFQPWAIINAVFSGQEEYLWKVLVLLSP